MLSRTQNVESPCVRRCCLSDADVCLGCFRTLDEILNWLNSTDEQRRVVVDQAQVRARLTPKPW